MRGGKEEIVLANLCITIARQYGSGGREIGARVAELLGCKLYDRELITMAANKGNLDENALRHVDEVAAGSLLYTLAMGSASFGVHTPLHHHRPINDRLFYLQSDIIHEIAERQSAVFIGRCADYVLREHPCTLSVFVYADDAHRIARIMEKENLPHNKALDLCNKVDHRRSTYYNFYTGGKWGKFDNYALAVNSSILGIDGTAKMIADFAMALEDRYKKSAE